MFDKLRRWWRAGEDGAISIFSNKVAGERRVFPLDFRGAPQIKQRLAKAVAESQANSSRSTTV